MIKDLGFFFFFFTISYGSCPFPPNSILTKRVFDLCRSGAVSTWRPTERYCPFLIYAIVSSFSSIFHDVVIYLFIYFFNLLLLVLCFKNSTLHICLKRIEDAHFFLHLVTYACNTLMYFFLNLKRKTLTLRCLLFHLPILGTWKNALFSSIQYKMLGFCGK